MTAAAVTTGTATGPGPDAPRLTGTLGRRLRMTLRMHRAALAAWTVLVLFIAGELLWHRFAPDAYAAVRLQSQCAASGGRACLWIHQGAFFQFQRDIADMVWLLRDVLPATVAAAAAALTGRELATGTAELAWTQSVSPARWLAEKLLLLGVFVASGTGVLVVLCRGLLDWSGAHGLLRAGYETNEQFFAVGPAVVTYGLLGLAFGFLAALAVRNLPLAVAAGAFATWGAAWVVDPWRTQIWPTVDRAARGEGPFGFAVRPCQYPQSEHKYSVDSCLGAQPAAHYWPAQLAETGFVIALAAVVAVAAFWRLRRRTG